MQTSAGIGLHFEEGLRRALARAALLDGAVRAVLGGVAAFGLALSLGVAAATSDAQLTSDCMAAREARGYGRAAAVKAMDSPEHQHHFLYRVEPDPGGYRVLVVAREGEWLGDAWERDAAGRMRHIGDVCRDQTRDTLSPLLGIE